MKNQQTEYILVNLAFKVKSTHSVCNAVIPAKVPFGRLWMLLSYSDLRERKLLKHDIKNIKYICQKPQIIFYYNNKQAHCYNPQNMDVCKCARDVSINVLYLQ